MCALRAHNSIPFLEKILSRIEKVLTSFSIPDKIFPKMNLLIYALRAYINRTQLYKVAFGDINITLFFYKKNIYIYIYIYIYFKVIPSTISKNYFKKFNQFYHFYTNFLQFPQKKKKKKKKK